MKTKLKMGCAFLGMTLPLLTTSCLTLKWENDDDKNIEQRALELVNYSREYKIKNNKMNLYFVEKGNVPYVDVDETIRTLKGYFDLKTYFSYKKIFRPQIAFSSKSGEIVFDWKNNEIYFKNVGYDNFTEQTLETNYSKNLKYAISFYKDYSPNNIVLSLDKYKFDILRHKGKIMIPFALFNTLFCSENYFNLYYTGQKVLAADFGMSDHIENIEQIKKSEFNSQLAPEDVRHATYNHLALVMDHYYGLRKHKKIDDFEAKYLSAHKDQFLSQDAKVYSSAYGKFFHGYLDELHTSISSLSFYDDPKRKVFDLGEDTKSDFRVKYAEKRLFLTQQRKINWDNKVLRFIDDETAVISFDQFSTGTKEQLQSAEPYKYDTYELFKKAFEAIEAKPSIKNIVIDLSLNGGGNVAAMWRTLGFLTDKKIKHHSYNVLDQTLSTTDIQVDIDGDGKYDKDAYSQYNWLVQTSINTFSAANQFANIAKEMKIAKIIGQKSGGGACSVLPVVLVDGTTVVISSNNSLLTQKGNEFKIVEDGIEPDLTIDYPDFYKDQVLSQVIKNSEE
ncbi:S41 family peptidase [Mycoplasmopsis hyopharyngis]|uniref:S41 family peptidase n=1 Tax=Mycoplasmopsis hyopharyngis TaxID=29558 RepID=UPI0038730030